MKKSLELQLQEQTDWRFKTLK
uniref:Uncharacterized protein n=1 Tax=Rhizophora mucronata TaxID=61149 RepID=A0A2P2NUI2_RHIMU